MTLLFATALFSAPSAQAWAEEQGEVRMESGAAVQQDVTLSGTDIGPGDNVPGNEFTHPLPDNSHYMGIAYCPTADIKGSSISYNSDINLPPSEMNPGFYKLSEYIDVKVAVKIGGHVSSEQNVPFHDIDNNDPDYDCIKNTGSNLLGKVFATGSSGDVIFKLRKSIDGGAGASTPGTINIFGKMTAGGSYGSEPLFKINLSTRIDYLPEKCTFNNGIPLDVNFNDIGTEGLDGSKHALPLNVGFVCSGGSFDAGDKPIRLSLRSNSVDGDYFQTDMKGLGIVVKEKGGVIKPNEKYPVSSPGNRGVWSLVAAPVARPGAVLKEGDFNASATLVASFE
ncbi:long polar fimbrial protein LpfD [Serratia ficaria]|nr:long polar fimbrial protein LpfD [Serratia ficaria]